MPPRVPARAGVILFLSLVPALPAGALAAQSNSSDELRLRPGDAVRLEVFESVARALPRAEDPSLARLLTRPEFDVDASGRVLLPVAGLVPVAGRPFGDVRREVERAFSAEFTNAGVRLTPLIRVAVLGEVRAPTLLTVDPTMTFADVLAAAGGLTEQANQKDVRLVRSDGTLLRTAASEVVGVDVALRSGDRVVVGRRSWISTNMPFVLGASASVVASILTALIVR
jgi:protein involved in polysaccharide export with SLBB domain